MRIVLLCLLAFLLCSAQDCSQNLPIIDDTNNGQQTDNTNPDDEGTDPSTDNQNGGTPTDGPTDNPTQTESEVCYRGRFECTDTPIPSDCGTWEFEVSDSDAIIGSGQITGGFDSAPIDITLNGITDPTATSFSVLLTSAANGSGEMELVFVEPTTDLTGTWLFTDQPGPDGTQVSGNASASPCESN